MNGILDPLQRVVLPETYRVPTFEEEAPVDIPEDSGSSSDFPGGEV